MGRINKFIHLLTTALNLISLCNALTETTCHLPSYKAVQVKVSVITIHFCD